MKKILVGTFFLLSLSSCSQNNEIRSLKLKYLKSLRDRKFDQAELCISKLESKSEYPNNPSDMKMQVKLNSFKESYFSWTNDLWLYFNLIPNRDYHLQQPSGSIVYRFKTQSNFAEESKSRKPQSEELKKIVSQTIDFCRNLETSSPAEGLSNYCLASVYTVSGYPDEARAECYSAFKQDSNKYLLNECLGDVESSVGNFMSAEFLYFAMLDECSYCGELVTPYSKLAVTYFLNKEYTQAIDILSRKYRESDAIYYLIFGDLLSATNEIDYSIESFRAYVLNLQSRRTYMSMSDYKLNLSFQGIDIKTLYQWDMYAFEKLNGLLVSKGEYNEALLILNQKVLFDKERVDKSNTNFLKAQIFFLLGDYEEALKYLKASKNYFKDKTNYKLLSAKIYIALDMKNKALSVLRELKDLSLKSEDFDQYQDILKLLAHIKP